MNLIDDKYEVLQQINEGGMAKIYKVRHRLLDEIRVVKVMRPQASASEDLRRRFVSEARMAIRVRHTNIGHLYDFSIDPEGTAVIVMEFIDGVTVQEILASGPPPSTSFAVDIAVQVLEALTCLHSHGIVHRDIASDNVMIARGFDGRPIAKVIDLGIAKDPAADAATATMSGVFLGKARYAAPEQLRADGQGPSPATDIYSFGVFLYEMLTGRLPIGGSSFAELAAGHLMQDPLPFAKTDPEGRVPEGLREAILTALRKDPRDRIASAEDFATRIRPFGRTGGTHARELDELLGRVRGSAPASPRALAQSSRSASMMEMAVEVLHAPSLTKSEVEILHALHEYSRRPGQSTSHTPTLPARPVAAQIRAPSSGSRSPREDFTREPPPRDRPRSPEARERSEERQESPHRSREKHRTAPRREPQEDMPRRSILPWLLVGIPLLAAGALVVWFGSREAPPPAPLPYTEQIVEVLALPMDSTAAIERKVKRLSSLIDFLPDNDLRKEELKLEKERLMNLQELHRQLDRLVALEQKASTTPGLEPQELKGVSQLWTYIREARGSLTGDDPDGKRIEDAARATILRIAKTPGAESLWALADEP